MPYTKACWRTSLWLALIVHPRKQKRIRIRESPAWGCCALLLQGCSENLPGCSGPSSVTYLCISQKWVGFYPLNNEGKKGRSTVMICSLAHPKTWALAIKQPHAWPQGLPFTWSPAGRWTFPTPHHTTQGTAKLPSCKQDIPAPGSSRWKTWFRSGN